MEKQTPTRYTKEYMDKLVKEYWDLGHAIPWGIYLDYDDEKTIKLFERAIKKNKGIRGPKCPKDSYQ